MDDINGTLVRAANFTPHIKQQKYPSAQLFRASMCSLRSSKAMCSYLEEPCADIYIHRQPTGDFPLRKNKSVSERVKGLRAGWVDTVLIDQNESVHSMDSIHSGSLGRLQSESLFPFAKNHVEKDERTIWAMFP